METHKAKLPLKSTVRGKAEDTYVAGALDVHYPFVIPEGYVFELANILEHKKAIDI